MRWATAVATAGGRLRLTTRRGGPSEIRAGGSGGGTAVSVRPCAGQRHRRGGDRAVDDERDVHRPVGAAVLAELAGAVERVDDPDPLGGEPGRRRRRPLPRARRRRDGRGRARRRCSRATHWSPMARRRRGCASRSSSMLAQLDEQLTGTGGDCGRAPMVRRRRRHQRRTIAAAECSGDRTTRTRVGGCRRRSRGAAGVRGDRPPDPSLRERRRRLPPGAVAVRGGARRRLARHRAGIGAARVARVGAGVAGDRRRRDGAAGRSSRATSSSSSFTMVALVFVGAGMLGWRAVVIGTRARRRAPRGLIAGSLRQR